MFEILRRARNPAENEQCSIYLDFARSLAALLVCLAHTRTLIFPDYINVGHASAPIKLFYFVTLFGVQSVVIFFVLSGLLVGGSLIRGLQKTGCINLRSYYIARISRLGVALYPAILLALLFQALGAYTTCQARDNILTVSANLIYLQNLIAEPLCNDHPLWSLSNEMFYYLTAPILLLAIWKKNYIFVIALVAAIAGLSYQNGTHQNIPFGYLLWGMGALAVFVRHSLNFLIPTAGLIVVLVISRAHLFPSDFISDSAIGVMFFALITSRFPEKRAATYFQIGSRGFSAFSYSLYLVHMPLAQGVAHFMPRKLDPADPKSYLVYLAVVALITLIACIFGRLFEDRYRSVRDNLIAWTTSREAI